MSQRKKKKRTHKSKLQVPNNTSKSKHKSKKNSQTVTPKTHFHHESRPTIYEYDIDDLLDEIDESEELENERKNWQKKSRCEIYSRSKRKWFIAEISDITFDDEGEWIVVRYNKNLVKEVQRFSDEIRPLKNRNSHKLLLQSSSNSNLLQRQSSHQSLVDSEAWRLMYETSQTEIKQLNDKLTKYKNYKEQNKRLQSEINNYKGQITILETETNCLKNEIEKLKTNCKNKQTQTDLINYNNIDLDFEEYKIMHRNTQTTNRKQIISYKKQLKAIKYEKIKFCRLFENEQKQNQIYKNNINELNNKLKTFKNEFDNKNKYLNDIINDRNNEIQSLKFEIKNLETPSIISTEQNVFDDIDQFLNLENLKLSSNENNENNEYNFISPTYESNRINSNSDANDSDQLSDSIKKENGLFQLENKRRNSLEL